MQSTYPPSQKDKFKTCPKCHSDNIYEDDGWWYCNSCGEVWEGE